ncbi:DUF6985 domain-containing protein [Photobacterium aphoticum]|uniref:DUF6985 domain-containing protein n=1 Tax=Photobacterium aphoticum TaxID=754436 RepID=A0A0J1GIE3_9GAMM|nr:hypothetical protein [Photobacterium aphoticum]KLU99482.1 hypothetical protein ABT58_16630 [Photobacterium aphoticum]PSU55846.1 hypothetical protein C9I90_15020 [Photobacterium aphoticum]GHA52708.1 hypothetical protein GCM10007086_28550 [Photobacterium aphoticum]
MYNVEKCQYPEIVTDDFFKYTSKRVSGFAGLQIRDGACGGRSSSKKSDGTVHFCCDKDLETEVFFDVIKWVEQNAQDILDLSLASFEEVYWEMRDLIIESLIDEHPDDVVPSISGYKDLKALCGVVAVHIKGSGTTTKPRFGIEFGCNWEDEHGAGVSFNGLDIIESGYASDAFDFE